MADEIRQRCGILMQKMTSLRIAVDERMMSFKAMTSEGGGSRPKTAFMRTPRNLSVLFDRLVENIEETKHLLTQTTAATRGAADAVPAQERNQIRGLIADLERELNRIAPRLNLRPATTTTTTRTTTTTTTTTSTELPAINRSSVGASESETKLADDKEIRSLPAIVVCSSDPTGVPTSPIVNPGTLRRRRPHDTRTMLLRMQLARDAASTGLRSNQGYPFDSSFPKLEPIHPRRSVRGRTRIAGGASDSNLSRTIESHKRQLKTSEPRQRYSRSP